MGSQALPALERLLVELQGLSVGGLSAMRKTGDEETTSERKLAQATNTLSVS